MLPGIVELLLLVPSTRTERQILKWSVVSNQVFLLFCMPLCSLLVGVGGVNNELCHGDMCAWYVACCSCYMSAMQVRQIYSPASCVELEVHALGNFCLEPMHGDRGIQ